MPSLSELRIKVGGIKSIQQITKAMKMIASVKLAQAQRQLGNSRSFSAKLESYIVSLASRHYCPADDPEQKNVPVVHPLSELHVSDRKGLVIVTADKGLCGGFNNNIIHQALSLLQQSPQTQWYIFVIGKKAQDYFSRSTYSVYKSYVNIAGTAPFHTVGSIAHDVMACYCTEGLADVNVIYTWSRSILRQKIVQERVLPFSCQKSVDASCLWDCIFEPLPKSMLDMLIPFYVKSKMFSIVMESYFSELASRMSTMDNASKNAQDLIEELTLLINNVRQATITRELTEIVGAGEALK